MNHFSPIALSLAALLVGCAPKVPMELANARSTFHRASNGPAKTLVPAELHKAGEALEQAEVAFKDDPRGFHTLDLAYVAQRKAELAETLAIHASETGRTADANATYQSTQDSIMLRTRADLGTARTDLAASQSAGAVTSAQLAASEEARLLSDQRARDAMEALAKLAAVKEEPRGMVITLSGSVLFTSDEATLLPAAQTRLAQVATTLLTTKERSLLIEGHTDSQGSDDHNMALSLRRAEAVRAFLGQQGYDLALIRAAGVGEGRPVGDNESAEGRANNRRVEIVVEPAKAER